MDIRSEIELFTPGCEQEQRDKAQMLSWLDSTPDPFTRANTVGHFSASSWIVSPDRQQVLLIYHNIYRSWAWTGGHADGERDLLAVALREAREESGLETLRVLKDGTTLKQTGSFYLAARPYAEKNGAFIQQVLDTFSQADALTQSQRQQSITLLAKTMGLPEPVIASYLSHRPPTTIAPVNAQVAALQQQTADLFYQNRLVPKQVNIRERIWQPAGKEGAKS